MLAVCSVSPLDATNRLYILLHLDSNCCTFSSIRLADTLTTVPALSLRGGEIFSPESRVKLVGHKLRELEPHVAIVSVLARAVLGAQVANLFVLLRLERPADSSMGEELAGRQLDAPRGEVFSKKQRRVLGL
jgi:hypothetical protein